MIESVFNPGDCLAVVSPQEADVTGDLYDDPYFAQNDPDPEAMCNGSAFLGLTSCNDPAAQWLFNGGNLISALCWKNGISSFMTVNEGCSELSVLAANGGDDALFRSQTFLLTEQDFIQTIVHASTDESDPSGETDYYCGTDWVNAANFCPKPCPTGDDAECEELGDGFRCYYLPGGWCHDRF